MSWFGKSSDASSNGKPTVLLVEDEEENQLLGQTLLTGIGANVLLAKNGSAALSLAQLSPAPNLILLDIVMPVMDGLTVLERLKSNPKTKAIPVLMLSSRKKDDEVQRAHALGAKGYLTKPYDIDAFQARVRLELGIPQVF